MSDSSLVPVNLSQLPTTQIGGDELYTELAKGSDFLNRLQLFSKGRAIDRGLIPPGHYGIPESDTEIIDLGTSVTVLPLARRPKALDMSDSDAVIISYDMQSAEFKRIMEASGEPESRCQYGPSFLVYEMSTRQFLEFFCGNKSSRAEAKRIFPYLPLSQEQIDAAAKTGVPQNDLKPHGPIPITLKVKHVETKRGSWHVPLVTKCSVPLDRLPSREIIVREITQFLSVKDNGVERVAEKRGRAR